MTDDLISRLSEIRSEYNCFDENEEPYYRALSEAIKILSRSADGDTISRKAAIEAVERAKTARTPDGEIYVAKLNAEMNIQILPSAEPQYEPVKAEDFARTMSRNTLYNFVAWHHEALTLTEKQGFVICKKTT